MGVPINSPAYTDQIGTALLQELFRLGRGGDPASQKNRDLHRLLCGPDISWKSPGS